MCRVPCAVPAGRTDLSGHGLVAKVGRGEVAAVEAVLHGEGVRVKLCANV